MISREVGFKSAQYQLNTIYHTIQAKSLDTMSDENYSIWLLSKIVVEGGDAYKTAGQSFCLLFVCKTVHNILCPVTLAVDCKQ